MEAGFAFGDIHPVVRRHPGAPAGADVEDEHGRMRIGPLPDRHAGHRRHLVQGDGRPDALVTDLASIGKSKRPSDLIDLDEPAPKPHVAPGGHAARQSIESALRVDELGVVPRRRRRASRALADVREVDGRLVAVLRGDAAPEACCVRLLKWGKKEAVECGAEAGHRIRHRHGRLDRGVGLQLAQDRTGIGSGKMVEMVLDRIRHQAIDHGQIHGRTACISPHRREPLDQGDDLRISPEYPVPAAKLEPVRLAIGRRRKVPPRVAGTQVVRRTDPPRRIGGFDDGIPRVEAGRKTGHAGADDVASFVHGTGFNGQ